MLKNNLKNQLGYDLNSSILKDHPEYFLFNKPEIITKNRGIISSGENKKPLLKLSFFCKNPLLFNKEILLNIN